MQSITRFATKSLALIVASASVAGAQTTISGSTLGCFGLNCTPTTGTPSPFAIGTSGASLSFTGTSFTGTTNPVTNGFTVGNFGSLVLNGLSSSTMNTTFSTPFTLLFQIANPGATTPMSTFAISGFVGNNNGQGARDISYTAVAPVAFTFTGGAGTIQIDGGQIGPIATTISGRVTALATVPEPSTYALLATGFVGLAGAMVRRRNNAA